MMSQSFLGRLALLALAIGVGSCAYDTPLRRVTFHVQAAGIQRDASQPLTFTSNGWAVTLTSAQVSIGPIYFYDGPPTAGTTTNQGIVVSQVLAIFSVDALNPAPRTLVDGNGTNQAANSAVIRLSEEEAGPIADVAGPSVAVARVAGFAQRGSTVVAFDGVLALPTNVTAYQQFTEHQVTQIPVPNASAPAPLAFDQGGTLTVRVDATRWFDAVSFDHLCAAGATAPCDFSSVSATNGLKTGVASSAAFSFEWASP